jgi:translation initiation factor IF-3
VNDRIRAREVRVIDENNEQMGIMFGRDALQLARSRDLDLVEVAPNAVPPVCRIMDYGKYRYEQTKRERESRRTQHNIVIKELRLGPNIDDNDLKTRTNAARRFMEEGHKVRFTVQFKGRELAHIDIGRDILNRIVQDLGNDIIIEAPPKMEGKKMSMLVSRKVPQVQGRPQPPRPRPGQEGEGVPTDGVPRPRPAQEGEGAPPDGASRPPAPVPAAAPVAASTGNGTAPAPAPVAARPAGES